MLDRWVEPALLPLLEREGVGCIAFSPLAQGLLTNRYFAGIPADSRAGHDPRFLRPEHVTDEVLARAAEAGRAGAGRAGRRWRRWRWPGCCGGRRSPRP